jgi:UDP-glucose 4-epimerase
MSYIGKTILITGGTGYIGSLLVESFNSIYCTVIVSTDDVSDKSMWEKFINPNIDFIFHLAAIEVGHDTIERDLNVNAVSVLHMLQTCVEKKCNPKIIFSSSTNVFGNVDEDVVNENTKSNPPAEWSAHKLLAENYLRIYSSRYGLETVILRLPNVYGSVPKRETINRMVINKVIKYGIENKQLKLYGNKDCYRDFIFVEDVVDAFMKIGLTDDFNGSFFVVGSNELVTISDVWNIIADKIGDVSISVEDVKLNPLEMRSYVGDCTKLNEVTGWKPEVDLESGIERTVKDLR